MAEPRIRDHGGVGRGRRRPERIGDGDRSMGGAAAGSGSALGIFFGPTPASRGAEIRPASPVNVLGRVLGDPTVFKMVRSRTTVQVERA